MDIGERIGAKVREIRKAKGLSQEELAHLAGLHRTFVSQVERAAKNVTIVSLDKIAKGLAVTLADLVS